MTKARTALAILLALLALSITSCKVGPDYVTPKAKVAGEWRSNPAVTNRPVGLGEAFWWRGFEDPVLNELVETAYRNNPTLQIAGVRILETRARLNKTIGNLFPQQQAVAGQVGYFRERGASFTSADLLFGATGEIDFWGKWRRTAEAARAPASP